MSRESQTAIRQLVEKSGPKTRQRLTDLAAWSGTLPNSKIDPKKFAPPYEGIPDYGCAGCDLRLPWQTMVRVKNPQGKFVVVDAHDCWGPSPMTTRGLKVAADTFTRLLQR